MKDYSQKVVRTEEKIKKKIKKYFSHLYYKIKYSINFIGVSAACRW
jgi:hypothetical protein